MTIPFVRDYEIASAGVYKWTLTDADGVGQYIKRTENALDKTVQVSGTFNSGTVTIQGSNQCPPVTWATLHDSTGADLAMTAAGIETIMEVPLFIRAILAGTAGAASVEVILVCKGRK